MNKKYKCEKCGFIGMEEEWEETEIYCECGGHQALICPKCEEVYDMVFNKSDDYKIVEVTNE